MNVFKKLSGIAIVLAIASTYVPLSVSAKAVNDVSLSYSTLNSSADLTTGNIIPAGAIKVTVSIDNNTGFTNNMFLFNLEEGYSVIVDNNSAPIIETYSSLDGFLSAASFDNGKLCVALASADACRQDGALFTFYCTSNFSTSKIPVSIGNLDESFSSDNNDTETRSGNIVRLKFGDVNGNGIINSSDATAVMIALSRNDNDEDDSNPILLRELYAYPDRIAELFPYYYSDNPYCYICADVLSDIDQGTGADQYIIKNAEAQEILVYAAQTGTGAGYSGSGKFGNHLFNLSNLYV